MTTGLTVSEVAHASGASSSAVRFYEAQGLITARRTSGNQRRFGPDAACRVKVARVAQRIGLSVSEIAHILEELPPEPTLDDWLALHTRLTSEAQHRIDELNATLENLTSGRRVCDL